MAIAISSADGDSANGTWSSGTPVNAVRVRVYNTANAVIREVFTPVSGSSGTWSATYNALTPGTYTLYAHLRRTDNTYAAAANAPLLVGGSEPSGAIPAPDRIARFDNGLESEIDGGWRIQTPFNSKPSVENGQVKIVTPPAQAEGPASYSRAVFNLSPQAEGADTWFGASFSFPNLSALKFSRFLCLASYGVGTNWYLGFEVTQPGTFIIGHAPYGEPHAELISISPPQGRLFRIAVHAKLSRTNALTEAFIDGVKVGQSTASNMYATSPLNYFQAGAAFWHPPAGQQTFYLDEAWIA